MKEMSREDSEAYRREVSRRAKWTITSIVFSTIALIFNLIVLYKVLQ